MSRGEIKATVEAIFHKHSAQRLSGEMSNTEFRTTVCTELMSHFEGMTLICAKTHYNNVKSRLEAANDPLVEGLGRAAEKRGGRPTGKKSGTFVLNLPDGTVYQANLKRADADAIIEQNPTLNLVLGSA
jgi:hypothetical protein